MIDLILASPPIHTTSDTSNGDGYIIGLVAVILLVVFVLITVIIVLTNRGRNQTQSEQPSPASAQPNENDKTQPKQSQSQSSDNVKPHKVLSPFRVFLKIVLIAALIVFALINYRIFTFDKGISQTDIGNKDFSEAITSLVSIRKVEYYKRTIPNGDYTYKVFIETANNNYLLNATQQDVAAIQALGFLSGSSKINKITPIPFYCELIVGFVILLIPIRKKITN